MSFRRWIKALRLQQPQLHRTGYRPLLERLEDRLAPAAVYSQFVDPDPAPGNEFGSQVVPLSTGNVVITSPNDGAGGASAGAVYLFNGATGALISTLRGSEAGDQIGSGGVTPLTNGNFVVDSPAWNSGLGAVTFGNGNTGIAGAVSVANSLVGSTAGDGVGSGDGIGGVTALVNGNYVVGSPTWANGAVLDAGAVTFGDGTTGISGAVSPSNSLVGSSTQDSVGSGGVFALANGNYVVSSVDWRSGSAIEAGAATFANGSTGLSGAITASNSLVGTTAHQALGQITPLTNGNYVVFSEYAGNGVNTGSWTFGSGSTGVTGVVSASNSLLGSATHDANNSTVTALTNGNYVVEMPSWAGVGAVTFGNGSAGISGVVNASISLVGAAANSFGGVNSVTPLTNGNYVVSSPLWSNGVAADVGAVTLFNGTTAVTGTFNGSNSLVGTTANDQVGSGGVTALTNGNYVVQSPNWSNGSAANAGAVTLCSGSTPTSGAVSASNSLVGSSAGDQVGSIGRQPGTGVTALTNGNFVADSPFWNGNLGAVTFGNGVTGVTGAISASNSLVGAQANVQIGNGGVLALANGNYVIESPYYNNFAGAVTLGNGVTGTTGTFNAANSLVGSAANDGLGNGGVIPLNNGNYVVSDFPWNGSAGAATFVSGVTGSSAVVSAANSMVGLTTNTGMELAVADNVNGNYYVAFPSEGGGIVRVGSQTTGIATTVTSLSTTTGSTNGGTTVVITGTGFTGATTVDFGTTAATFTVNSSTQITATSPAGAPGVVDVTVVGPGGTSATSAADQFTYMIWNQFNGNAQHTGISTVAAQNTDHILWQTSINLAGSYFWHTGEPIFTPSDTVIVPVKVTSSGQVAGTANYELEAFNGNTGALLWTVTSQYVAVSNGWLPPYQPVYDPVTNRVYFAGRGGTLEYISNPDNPGSSTPTPVQEAFFGTANYNANPSGYNSSIYIDTPLTVDNSGNIFFGYYETGSNPSGISDGGIARVSAAGVGSHVSTGTAVGVGTGAPAIGSAPALSNDDSILYVAMVDSNGPYLVGVNATTLAFTYSVNLTVPNSSTSVSLNGLSTAAPMVAPDGTVFMGVYSSSDRGYMTHYSANLATESTPGAFGWDDTASIVPTSMVPSYTGTSPYLILTKYNNYAGIGGGNGVNEIAILDPFATQTDPNNDPNPNLLVMKEVLTMTSPTGDSGNIASFPDATREWCTNGTAIDPATDSVFINNEDGFSYRWNLATDTLSQAVEITSGYGEPYTPTAIGPNGVVYAINGGTLFALGGYSNYTVTTTSSLNSSIVDQAVTFTTTLTSTNGGPTPTGTVTFYQTSGVNNPINSTPLTLGAVPVVNGQASFTTSTVPGNAAFLAPAHYHIYAVYSGDSGDGYASGETTQVQVVLETTTTTLSTSASPVAGGQSVTFTATVTPAGTSFTPLGSVSFYNGATLLGTAKVNASNQAALTTSSLPAGIDAITAVYSGDLNFNGSTSAILNESVGPTSITLTDNGPNPSASGQAVSFTVNVSGGTLISGETVTIEDASNANAVVASPTLTNGAVTFSITGLSVGTHQLFAVYGGDATHAASNNSTTPVSQTVLGVVPAVSSVVINGGAPQYTDANGTQVSLAGQNSVVEQILVTFNEPVTLDPGAFTITNNAGAVTVLGGTATPNTAAVALNAPIPVAGSGGTQFILTFQAGAGTSNIPGGSGTYIKDGVYILNTIGSHVHANSQTALDNQTGFWALFGSVAVDNQVSANIGDGNSDILVDTPDAAQFKIAFATENDSSLLPDQAYDVAMDSNLSGVIGTEDAAKFKSNFGAEWMF